MIQTKNMIEKQYDRNPDPWGYDQNLEDHKRLVKLIEVIPPGKYLETLDVGCGNGFITRHLPGLQVLGIDISEKAIAHAIDRCGNHRLKFRAGSIFDIPGMGLPRYDLIVITGLLYPHYIGQSSALIHQIIDDQLNPGGILAVCHIEGMNPITFPAVCLYRERYPYREFTHLLEIYEKAGKAENHDPPLSQS